MPHSEPNSVSSNSLSLPSSEEFMKRAQEITGLSNFGNSMFEEPLGRFLESCNKDAALNVNGIAAVSGLVTKALVNRLRFEDHIMRYPEILEIEIRDPLIIIGIPRVGSTKLHKLLGADPAVNTFRFWQLLNPAPFPDSHNSEADPRIAVAEQLSDHLMRSSPDFFAGYIPVADHPEEDHWLFDLTFMQYSFILTAVASSYNEWLMEQNMRPAFEYMKRLHQFMIWQSHTQNLPLVLKAPTHSLDLEILAEIYPRAKFVQPHRNPIQCVASVLKLVAAAAAPGTNKDHTDEINRVYGEIVCRMATRSIEARKKIGEQRFLDVPYEDIRDKCMDVSRKVHEFWGVPLSEESERLMISWDDENTQHKYGEFKYSIDDSKFPPREIIRRMAPYVDRFYPNLLDPETAV